MNYKKTIKDLKELNNQLKGKYSDEQNRNYCLQCKIDKLEKEKQKLIDYLKKEVNKAEVEFPENGLIGWENGFYSGRYYALKLILNKLEKR